MANTDPVSGLMASMSRIRASRPDGVAQQAGTAAQATTASQKGTALPPAPLPPTPTVTQPTVRPTSFAQVLPAAVPAQPVEPASAGSEYEVARIAGQLLDTDAELSIGDAYLMSLAYNYGVRNPVANQTGGATTAL